MAVERLQKFLSNAGIASRRRAETLIEKGAVKINGVQAKLGDKVDPYIDKVTVDGKVIIPEKELFYIAVNKPINCISSRFDPEKRKSVYDFIPKALRAKVWSVGRLDFKTEGLILFTNDGDLTEQLAHPKYEHEKEYEIVLNHPLEGDAIGHLRSGMPIGDGDMTSPAKVRTRDNKVFMTIHEGKKRQIRRMFQKLGYKVAKLKRIRLNKLELGDLPIGKFKYVQKEDII